MAKSQANSLIQRIFTTFDALPLTQISVRNNFDLHTGKCYSYRQSQNGTVQN